MTPQSEFADDFGTLEEEFADIPPALAPVTDTPEERAETAVKNALLENRVWKLANGQKKKIHNISDAHSLVWEEITSDGRGNRFLVISLLWVLLRSPNEILKVGALNISTLRYEVLKFAEEEKIKDDRFDELEEALATMLEEVKAVQAKPVPDDEGKP